MSYLIDTNVISEIVRARPEKKVLDWFEFIPSDSIHLSVLSFGEIRRWIEKLQEPNKKEKLRIWLEHELPNWFGNRILFVDKGVADCWGRLQSQSKNPLPAIDSLIAATAIYHGLSLVTRNPDDFKFDTLEVINPWNFA